MSTYFSRKYSRISIRILFGIWSYLKNRLTKCLSRVTSSEPDSIVWAAIHTQLGKLRLYPLLPHIQPAPYDSTWNWHMHLVSNRSFIATFPHRSAHRIEWQFQLHWPGFNLSLIRVKMQPKAFAYSEKNLFDSTQVQIEQLVAKGEVPSLSVAVARDGKIIWEKGFGLADREKNIPATQHTKYRLASISKQLTTIGGVR